MKRRGRKLHGRRHRGSGGGSVVLGLIDSVIKKIMPVESAPKKNKAKVVPVAAILELGQTRKIDI